MRAVMKSFGQHKQRQQHPSVTFLGTDTGTKSNLHSSRIQAEVHQEQETPASPPQHEQQPPEPQESTPLSQDPTMKESAQPTSPQTDSQPQSPSLPLSCKESGSAATSHDTTSHESVDWTNATEATSFSEHEDVVLVVTEQATSDGNLNDEGNEENTDLLLETPAKARLSRVVGELVVEEFASSQASSSSSSCESSSCSNRSCGTSECAVKAVGIKDGEEDEQKDHEDDDDDQSWNDVPVVITLINDNVRNSDNETTMETTVSDGVTSSTRSLLDSSAKKDPDALQQSALLRLERAEAMLESYRNMLKSNEHLIESLEQTLLETRESAQDLWVERNRLEQELEQTLDEQDAILMMEKNCTIRRIHTLVLAVSLTYYLMGGSEYVLIFVATVYLLEDILSMSL